MLVAMRTIVVSGDGVILFGDKIKFLSGYSTDSEYGDMEMLMAKLIRSNINSQSDTVDATYLENRVGCWLVCVTTTSWNILCKLRFFLVNSIFVGKHRWIQA